MIYTASVTENKAAKRSKIIESAYSLFLNNSFAATAIDDVVKMAGIAKGTFYLYFKDKYDLLNQILIFKSTEIIGSAIDYAGSRSDAVSLPEKCSVTVNYIIDYLARHRDFTALLNKNLSRCFKQFASDDLSGGEDLKKRLVELFKDENIPEDRAMMTLYIMTDLIGSLACDAILGLGPYTLETIRPYLIETAVRITGEGKDD